jgi:hypothetical protein
VSYVNACYGHEFRSPPVPLVALLGCPEAHRQLSDFCLHALRPPLVTLCCAAEPLEHFVPRAFSSGARPGALWS